MGLVLAPIAEGKADAWKAWAEALAGPKKGDFDDFNRRYDLTLHQAWWCETPNGPAIVAIHDGPGADTFMQKLGQSDHAFDKEFIAKLSEFHDMDVEFISVSWKMTL